MSTDEALVSGSGSLLPVVAKPWPDPWSRGRHRGPSYGRATIRFAKRHVRGHFYGSAVLRQLDHALPRIRTALTTPKMAVLAPVRTIVSTVAGVKPGDFRRARTAYRRSRGAWLETRKGVNRNVGRLPILCAGSRTIVRSSSSRASSRAAQFCEPSMHTALSVQVAAKIGDNGSRHGCSCVTRK